MHIHKPKPLHGWREFVGEVGIIVVGILIALTAEEALTEYNWHRRVERAEMALKAEAGDASMNFIEQRTAAPCILAQIDDLHAKIVAGGRLKDVPSFQSAIGRSVVRMPDRDYTNDVWTSLLADGTAAHMNGARRSATADYYNLVAGLHSGLPDTESTQDSLLVLLEPIPLDAAGTFQMLQTLARLRNHTVLTTLVGAQSLGLVRDLKRMPPAGKIREFFDGLSKSATINICRQRHLPLADWRKELADQPVLTIPSA